MKRRGGIYVHVPVCRRKCLYCSFFSVGERLLQDWSGFVDAVLKEFHDRSQEIIDWSEVTIYIGGGTPSLMPTAEFSRLMSGLTGILHEMNPAVIIGEVTMEVNPDDVTVVRAQQWSEAGVNRVSMGVQTLVDKELKSIGRRHDAATAREAYGILRGYFDNVSLDLMFGLPYQTLESLRETLDGFAEMRPEHISAYSLMYEERSALTRMRDTGKLEETDEDISVSMFKEIGSRLREAGYDRYEISNYSLPGYESKHNSSYWEGIPYIGLGPSAHSYDGSCVRRWNVADIAEYLKGVATGKDYYEKEHLDRRELIEERIMTGLRKASGIDLFRFEEDFGSHEYKRLRDNAEKGLAAGLLEIKDDGLRLTEKGVMISDEIIVELF